MSGERGRRGLFAVCIVALVAIVCLLLGHRWLQGYLDEQNAKQPSTTPEPAAGGGVTGRVKFADGSPAASARVRIAWTDSAGRPGATPSLTDSDGRFRQGNVPVNATVSEISATVGPLVATSAPVASGAKITLPAEFRLAGLLRRRGDREPIAGATLEIAGVRATTGAQGEFAIEHVTASVLRESRPIVRIAADGFQPLDWPLPRDALPETYGDVTILLETSK